MTYSYNREDQRTGGNSSSGQGQQGQGSGQGDSSRTGNDRGDEDRNR